MASPVDFNTGIYRLGANFALDVPAALSGRVAGQAWARVRGTLNGVRFAATLVPRGGGRHRVFVRAAVLASVGAREGDVVRMRLDVDPRPEEPAVPGDLARALDAAGVGVAGLEAQPPGRRREIVEWIRRAKRPHTREGRIAVVVDRILRADWSRRDVKPG